MKGVDPATGNTWFRESGIDRGDGGYRCRWTVKGARRRIRAGSTETTGRKPTRAVTELGAEKSGFNEKGERGGRRGGNCTTRQKIAAVAMMAMIVE